MYSLVILLLSCVCSGYIYHANPFNEDPAKADPYYNITCVNLLPDFDFLAGILAPPFSPADSPQGNRPRPRQYWRNLWQTFWSHSRAWTGVPTIEEFPQISPEYEQGSGPISSAGASTASQLNLHQICAHVQYGGMSASVQGYTSEYDYIAFHDPVQTARGYNTRLMIYCLLRCTQDNFLYDTPVNGRVIGTRDYPRHFTRQIIELDRPKQWWTEEQAIGDNHPRTVIPLRMTKPRTPNMIGHYRYADMSKDLLTVHPRNLIQCNKEPLPQFIPAPGTANDFKNNTELCAIALSGGNPTMNAGGYCHNDEDTSNLEVWFADEMTPMANWTWSATQFSTDEADSRSQVSPERSKLFDVALLRDHCIRSCWCREDPKQKIKAQSTIINMILGDIKGGTLNPSKYTPGSSLPAKSPPQDGASSSSSSSSSYSSFASSSLSSTCGASCTSPNECLQKSTATCKYLGVCKVDPASMISQVSGSLSKGMMIGYTAASCLRAHSRPLSRLNGRGATSMEIPEDEPGLKSEIDMMESWPCACNSSVVSFACCGAENGLVERSDHAVLGHLVS